MWLYIAIFSVHTWDKKKIWWCFSCTVCVYVQRSSVYNDVCVCLCVLYLDQSAIMAAGWLEWERAPCDFSLLFYKFMKGSGPLRGQHLRRRKKHLCCCSLSPVRSLARSLTPFTLSPFTSKHTFNWLHSNQSVTVAGAWHQAPFCQLFIMWIEQLSSTDQEQSVISNKYAIYLYFISVNKEQECAGQTVFSWIWSDLIRGPSTESAKAQ